MPDPRIHVENATFELLNVAASSASELKIRWLITGAMGRVLLLEEVYNLPRGRATEDVDFGVMVENWDHYQALILRICEDGRFHQDGRQTQRLNSEYGSIDLVPFGGVESDENLLRWPPDGDFVMNVAGFREACDDAVPVLVNDTLVVHVVSPVGLLLLKLVAWEDRHTTQPGKDAADIAYVLRHSPTFLGEDTLYKEHFDMVTASGFDLELVAARALGRKLSNLVLEPTSQHVRKLLERELTNGIESKLVREVSESLAPAGEIRAHALLSQVLAGLSD